MDTDTANRMALTDSEPSVGEPLGPWNPGVKSFIPGHLLPLSTIFRPENSFTGVQRACELRDFTGLELSELVTFRPERLVLHELLIRVTADFSVPDGVAYQDLGINFRSIVGVILSKYLAPKMDEIATAYIALQRKLSAVIDAETTDVLGSSHSSETARPAAAGGSFWFQRWSRVKRFPPESRNFDLIRFADEWDTKAGSSGDGLYRAACSALAKVVRVLYSKYGHSWGTLEMIGSIAKDWACNDFCSEEIGRLIEPEISRAVQQEGYKRLPAQAQPVVMNIKGAPASGKSTLRPLQRVLADRIGVRWDDFALISPDIWRKQLLDSATLGADHRYGAMLTSEELAIIDQKLDRYMARKAEQGRMSHLLIDRFRFGGLGTDPEKMDGKLLTRFGRAVYLFFMITPPEALVDRAWKRGLKFGRYKAVDDLLAHSVEAYAVMPQLFLTWAQRTDKEVHYEFLDNSVCLGERPRTVAFGWNGEMFILNVEAMLDVERFKKICIDATGPEQLYPDAEYVAKSDNSGFLARCVRGVRQVSFADAGTGHIYLRMVGGIPVWADPMALAEAAANPKVGDGLRAIAPGAFLGTLTESGDSRSLWDILSAMRIRTLGSWGDTSGPVRQALFDSSGSGQRAFAGS